MDVAGEGTEQKLRNRGLASTSAGRYFLESWPKGRATSLSSRSSQVGSTVFPVFSFAPHLKMLRWR